MNDHIFFYSQLYNRTDIGMGMAKVRVASPCIGNKMIY